MSTEKSAVTETQHKAAIPSALANFSQLPDEAFVRLPVVQALRGGISAPTVWRHVKAGLLPKPVKLSANTTAWRVGDLRRVQAEAQAA